MTEATVTDVSPGRKYNTGAFGMCGPVAERALFIAQLFAYQRNKLFGFRIDQAGRLFIGVTELEEVISDVQGG